MRTSSSGRSILFDPVIYTANRKLRLLGSRKLTSTRIKRLHSVVNREYYTEAEMVQMQADSVFQLRHSFVGFVDERRSLLVSPPIPQNRPPLFPVWSEENKANALRILECIMPGVFAYRDMSPTGSIVNLYRCKPAKCDVCDRVHDNENAFLVLKRGKPYFVCRRNTENPLLLEDDDDVPMQMPIVTVEDLTERSALVKQMLASCVSRCVFYE